MRMDVGPIEACLQTWITLRKDKRPQSLGAMLQPPEAGRYSGV